jgi:TRAP-type uncharacterized transport system fused permease subunit
MGRESRRSTTRIVKEEKMDSQFWLGVIITVVVGLPGAYVIGILANMHTPRLVHFLESRKLLKTHKTRQQALRIFNRIKAFRDGTRDRYPFYILLASAAVVCGIIASTLILVTVFQNEFPLAIPFYLLAAIAALMMLLLLIGIYETARHIERFDDYKTEIEQRWGPIDDGHPEGRAP